MSENIKPKPTIVPVTQLSENTNDVVNTEPITIAKPGEFSLDKFKSKRAPTVAGVATLLTALPHHSIADAIDFVQLHPNEAEYWSPELCFVNVPIEGQMRETLHLVEEDLAMEHVPDGQIQRFRLALATKPFDKFFLCHVPSRYLDNTWNATNLEACRWANGSHPKGEGKPLWTRAISRKSEGVEGYLIKYAKHQDAFAPPMWPKQTLDELICTTFANRMINAENHPGLLRLIGAKQSLS
jgi:hypothetical protein